MSRTVTYPSSISSVAASYNDDTPHSIGWPPPRSREEQPTERMTVDLHEPFPAINTALLHDIYTAVPLAIVALGDDGRVQYWSPSATRLLGWAAEEVVGHQPMFVPTERFTEHHRILAQAHAGVPVREVLTHRHHRNGTRVPIAISAAPHEGGGVVMTMRIAADESAYPAATHETIAPDVRQMETLGRLASGLTQEFTNLVAAISGSADMLAEWLPPKTAGREHAEVIRAAVRHAARLTNQVVSYAKPSSFAPSEVDLSETLHELDGLLRAAAGTSVQCIIRTDERLPRAWADRSRIDRIILELVVQARESMPNGGTLAIRTSLESMGLDHPSWPVSQPAGEYLCITVTDTGDINNDLGSSRLTGPVARTGLPSIAGWQSIFEAVSELQGVILSDTDVTIGHVYRVYLPAVRRWQPSRVSAWELPIGSPTMTVLLVDDDDSAREFAKTILEMAGYNVIEARGGEEAELFARLAREPIDLVVTDVVMPGLGGRRLLEHLRLTRPGLPGVMISAYPQPEEEYDPETLFVAKPFTFSDLLSTVGHLTRSMNGVR